MPKSFGDKLNLSFTMINPPQSPPQYQLNHSRSSLITNFNSLYDSTTSTSTHFTSGDFSSDSDYDASTPDFSTAFASQRFFFSSPGRSNSIVDSSTGNGKSKETSVAGGGIAVPTYSPDPYTDFRRSMQEMVEAREKIDVRENWDYLQELLTCYLSLNPKSTHKFILQAFADLLVTLMPSGGGGGGGGDR